MFSWRKQLTNKHTRNNKNMWLSGCFETLYTCLCLGFACTNARIPASHALLLRHIVATRASLELLEDQLAGANSAADVARAGVAAAAAAATGQVGGRTKQLYLVLQFGTTSTLPEVWTQRFHRLTARWLCLFLHFPTIMASPVKLFSEVFRSQQQSGFPL